MGDLLLLPSADHGAENFSRLRRVALNLLKQAPCKGSLKGKRIAGTGLCRRNWVSSLILLDLLVVPLS